MCRGTSNYKSSFFLEFVYPSENNLSYTNSQKFCTLVNKQLAHEEKRDINALLRKTTSASSSQDATWKIHQRLPKFHRFIMRWQPPPPTNTFLGIRQQNVNIVTKIQTIFLDFFRTFVQVSPLCRLSFVSIDRQQINNKLHCHVFVTNQ